jgi:hypothetical protein
VDSFLAISSVETLALSKLLISSSTTLGAVGNAVGFWNSASSFMLVSPVERRVAVC